jgi:hypothetical protein
MTEQQEERLRAAVRTWLDAADDLTRAAHDAEDFAEVVELADRATLARLAFHQTLVDLGWTPPATPSHLAGPATVPPVESPAAGPSTPPAPPTTGREPD